MPYGIKMTPASQVAGEMQPPASECGRGYGRMALIPALRWRIGCKIECISVHQDLRLHGDGVTDSLHHVATVFGIANQSGQALRRFVRLDFQTGFKTLTSAL